MIGMVAPAVLGGPINGDRFEAYVDRALVPDLRRRGVAIMDKLSSHKPVPNFAEGRAGVCTLIEAAGARPPRGDPG